MGYMAGPMFQPGPEWLLLSKTGPPVSPSLYELSLEGRIIRDNPRSAQGVNPK